MKKMIVVLIIVAFVVCPSVFADQPAEMMAMLEGMKRQMSELQKTIDAQNLRIQQLESKKVLEMPQPSVAVQPAPAQMSDADWEKGIKDNIGTAVGWMKGLKFGGDFRLRYEAFDYYDKNQGTTSGADENGNAFDRARNRFRIRLRFGFEKELSDDWKVGFRLATGATTNITSTNTTLTDNFAYKTVLIDRAFAEWNPNGMKDYGPIKGLTMGAGKFENPFLRYSTPIIWDADVTPEGAYEKMTLQIVSEEEDKFNVHGTAGQFITAEGAGQNADTEIYAVQTAFSWSTYRFGTELPVELTSSLALYDYPGYQYTTWASYPNTNTSALGSPRVFDVYNEVVFFADRTPVTFWCDFVNNINDVDPTRAALREIHASDSAWGLGGKIGKLKNKNDWEAFYGYYEIGANSVASAFSDSDFGGPNTDGFSNRKGHKFGIGWQIGKSTSLNWTGYIVTPLDLAPTSTTLGTKWATNETTFRSQLDLNYKF